MGLLDALAEERILKAIERGELRGLPGEGAPLELEENLLISEEVRVVNRILKNAGLLPPDVAMTVGRHRMGQQEEAKRTRALSRLGLPGLGRTSRIPHRYFEKLVRKLGGDSAT
jgi:hypothetical protein